MTKLNTISSQKIKTDIGNACYYHVTYEFQSEYTVYKSTTFYLSSYLKNNLYHHTQTYIFVH